jgi:hypothetical protein
MYDFLENEDVYWENTTHATDLFGERAVQIIERQVRQVYAKFKILDTRWTVLLMWIESLQVLEKIVR